MNMEDLELYLNQFVNLPELDAHGVALNDVKQEVEYFLFDCYNKNDCVLKIIHGIGNGKMEKEIIEYLQAHPLVEKLEKMPGSCIVKISKRL